MRSTTYDKLNHLYQKFEGYVSTRKLMEEGFTNRQIAFLINENYLEKVCHGYYWMLQCGHEKPFDYKCIEICLSNPRAVISMASACYYQGIIKREPEPLTIATERTDRSAMKVMFPVKRHYFSSSNFEIGIRRIQTKDGSYNIYNIERALCDIVRLNTQDTSDEFMVEIFDHIKERKEQYERISQYAKLLKVKSLIP